MKTLRSFCAAATLILMLSLPTMAGDIPIWGIAQPPPPPSATTTEPDDSEGLVAEIALSILELLPGF